MSRPVITPLMIGYAGASLVLLAAYSGVALLLGPGEARAGSSSVLLLVALNAAAWIIGGSLKSRAAMERMGPILLALGDSLLPLSIHAVAALAAPGPASARLAAAAAWIAYLALGYLRVAAGVQPPYAYFVSASGGLLALLTRQAVALDPAATLWLMLVLGLVIWGAATRVDAALRAHFSLAALALLTAATLIGAAASWRHPSVDVLLALLALSAVLLVAAAFSRGMGPDCRLFGLAASVALTLSITALIRYAEAPLPAYLIATSAWVAILTAAGIALPSHRAEPFRESAHWLAAALGLGLFALSVRSWWPLPGLERGDLAPGVASWIPTAMWREWPTRVVTPISLAVVAGALAALASWRQRYPPIAYSVAGFIGNVSLNAVASYAAPLILVPASISLWVAADAPRTFVPAVPLLLGAGLLALSARVDRLFPARALRVAGYAALLAAAAVAVGTREHPVATLLAVAAVALWRSLEERALGPHLCFLAATTAAAVVIVRRPLGVGVNGTLGVVLVSGALLAVYRLMLVREGPSVRANLALGSALVGACVALALELRGEPSGPALFLLWLGVPLCLAGEKPRRGHFEYEPVVFVGDWLETATYLLAHGAGAAFLVLMWKSAGFRVGDAGPVLAAWAWAHLGLFRWLGVRLPGRPATLAIGIAAYGFAALSLVLPSFSSSRSVLVASLLMNAILFFHLAHPRGTRSPWPRRIGQAFVVVAIVLAAGAGAELAFQALLGAAAVFLWRSLQEGGLGPHVGFLGLATAATLLASLRLLGGVQMLPLGMLAVVLLFVSVLLLGREGRNPRSRLTLAWATVSAAAALLIALARGRLAPLMLLPIWLGFTLGLEFWDRPARRGVRPDEPEDPWLLTGAYLAADVAGAAWLVSEVLRRGLGPGGAAVALAGWAALHIAVSEWLAWWRPERAAPGAARASGLGFAVAALALAALPRARGGEAVAACGLVGTLFLVLRSRWARRSLEHAAAISFVEAAWVAGTLWGVTLREFYLTLLAVYLYFVLYRQLPAKEERPEVELHALSSWAGLRDWLRVCRRGAVPVAILALTVVYPFWALMRSGDAVHLFFLGAATLAVLYGFLRGPQHPLFRVLSCVLLLAGAAGLVALGDVSAGVAGFLVAIGLLIVANLNVGGGRDTANLPGGRVGGRS